MLLLSLEREKPVLRMGRSWLLRSDLVYHKSCTLVKQAVSDLSPLNTFVFTVMFQLSEPAGLALTENGNFVLVP